MSANIFPYHSILFQGCIISEILDNNNQPINIIIYI